MIMSEKAVRVKEKSLLERGALSYSYLNTVPGGNEEKKNGKYCIAQILTLSLHFSS